MNAAAIKETKIHQQNQHKMKTRNWVSENLSFGLQNEMAANHDLRNGKTWAANTWAASRCFQMKNTKRNLFE